MGSGSGRTYRNPITELISVRVDQETKPTFLIWSRHSPNNWGTHLEASEHVLAQELCWGRHEDVGWVPSQIRICRWKLTQVLVRVEGPSVLQKSCLFLTWSPLSFFLTPRSHNWNLDGGKRAVLKIGSVQLSSVQSPSRVWFFATHGLQHAMPPCPSPTPGAYSNSCPSSQWCHPTISSSVVHPLLLLPSIFLSIRVFSNESALHQVAKVLEFLLQHQSFQWIFRTDFL